MIRIGFLVPKMLVEWWDESAKNFDMQTLRYLASMGDPQLRALVLREVARRTRNN